MRDEVEHQLVVTIKEVNRQKLIEEVIKSKKIIRVKEEL